MKKLLFFFALFLLTRIEIIAQELVYAKNIETAFFSEARFENIEAASVKGASVLNIRNGEIAFKVPIRSFQFANGLMQEHFNENYMESDKYPNATFKGKIEEGPDLTKNGTYQVVVNGQFFVHGITKDRTITGVIVVKESQIQLTSSFVVPVQEHQIRIPNDKISNISQNIKVKVKAVYAPKN